MRSAARQEPWVIVCIMVVIVVRDRKARALRSGRNHLAIDDTVHSKALADEALATVHVIQGVRAASLTPDGVLHGLVVNACRIDTVAVLTVSYTDVARYHNTKKR